MSLALIEESAKEVRRLAIAGSALAVGDFRLKKLIPPLEQAGAKVPVFAQVAKAMSEVVNGKEAESASRLLSLSTLLNAILYTQGQTGAGGDLQKLETFATQCATTRTTARVLKPLVEALSASGGGRFEIVKSGVERGVFNDLRLIDPAIRALGDNYPELADLVAEKILPAYGPGIVPRLKATFDLKGKKSDARKLEVMHRLDSAGTLELCKKALEDGSVEVKVTAIGCLGEHEECLPLVLEQVNAKNKQLRAAALTALASRDRPEITKIFSELVKGKELDILAGPFRALRNPQVLNSLLDEGRRVFELLLKGDGEQIGRFFEILDCLKERKDAEVEAFILTCFGQCEKLPKFKAPKKPQFVVIASGVDISDRLVWLLYELGTPKALEAVVAKREVLPVSAFIHVLHSALRIWSAEKIYTEFSPLLEQTKGAGRQKGEQLERAIYASMHRRGASFLNRYVPDDEETDEAPEVTWDSRWLDAAIKADRPETVCALARPGHKAVVTYLLKLVEAKSKLRPSLIIEALSRCQYSKITDLFLTLVTKRTKGSKQWDYELQHLIESAQFLPPADLPRLEEFAANLDQNYVDHFLEAIAPLRPTPQSN
jgi:hypothetical protein